MKKKNYSLNKTIINNINANNEKKGGRMNLG